MERFVKGDIVVVPFPFSDLSSVKRRPAFVITDLGEEDVFLCQITSKAHKNKFSISIETQDFKSGSLNKTSNIRPDKIFTCSRNIILYKIGSLHEQATRNVINSITDLVKR
ncbi:MAG: type II toxin-antitoxin system PemK/MazF family toxin [Balneolales bacterium]|nr:type II toxin-antitoxin system PemK/MazF family toxin [Balneolales bacterium]